MSGSTDKIAILIVNYNLPERVNALCERIQRTVYWPYELIVIGNGSDLTPPSCYTTVQLEQNVQTTNGWLAGLRHAKSLQEDWFAYWFMITSAEFVDYEDVLTPLATVLKSNTNAVGIHPTLTPDSTTAHQQLIAQCPKITEGFYRQVNLIDNIASLYRADWFDSIGWFDPDLTYAWGIDLETCWKARRDGRTLWVHEGCRVKKVTDIGYTMKRMNMTAKERRELASKNMEEVLSKKYGKWWLQRMLKEYT